MNVLFVFEFNHAQSKFFFPGSSWNTSQIPPVTKSTPSSIVSLAVLQYFVHSPSILFLQWLLSSTSSSFLSIQICVIKARVSSDDPPSMPCN